MTFYIVSRLRSDHLRYLYTVTIWATPGNLSWVYLLCYLDL
jgi:hypothetical protein